MTIVVPLPRKLVRGKVYPGWGVGPLICERVYYVRPTLFVFRWNPDLWRRKRVGRRA